MTTSSSKRILIAPLDWGLGHTARCVPIIRHIQHQGHTPVVAGNKWQRSFIEHTFGTIDYIHLDGYNVTYSKLNRFAQLGLFFQLPRLLRTIRTEHNWLLAKVKEHNIDGIISDNRYGLYHPRIPSVILTHQLQVQTGMGSVADRYVQKQHYKHLHSFGETWSADVPGTANLSGTLSHTQILPKQAKYIGLLSQFKPVQHPAPTDGSILILLSGPEPQRSALAKILWQQVLRHKGKVVFIEGSETAAAPANIPAHITYHKRLTSEELEPVMLKAGVVICRSGYSTIMDLVALRKKAILIPTPGQTEQEYLAKRLNQQDAFYTMPQKVFDLPFALREASNFPFRPLPLTDAYTGHQAVINDWLQTL